MDYEVFKTMAAERFMDYMPEQYKDGKLMIQEMQVVNQFRDGINICWQEGKDNRVLPTIYLDDLYEAYQKSGDIENVLKEAAEYMSVGIQAQPELQGLLDFDRAGEQIIMTLIHTEQNKELLESLPHREIQDLSIVYRWLIDKGESGIASALVNYEVADKIGMEEGELYHAAMENTKRIFPPDIHDLNEIIREMILESGMEENMFDFFQAETPQESTQFVITNSQKMQGAAVMLYEGELQKLAERLGDDLYILPSSIHEIIAVPASFGNPDQLSKIVSDINGSEVPLKERLSNQVYHYDKKLQKLTMATDAPNKRLDGDTKKPFAHETREREELPWNQGR